MSDLAQVRAEIKTWERHFVSTHGRDPSIQDIRDQPPIAEKYKLYKKLSKLHPTTPPRSRLPLPHSPATDSVPPLPGFNPFSPTKKVSRSLSHANPFATPAKVKHKRRPPTPTPSPDPFPTTSVLPASTTAVSRARKRLRGDPVSPSPVKPKRHRVYSSPVSDSDQHSSDSDHQIDNELPSCDLTSFVADSPVKAPAGGKSFKLLFDDAIPSLSIPKKPLGSSLGSLDTPFLQPVPTDSFVPTSYKHNSKAVSSGPEHPVSRARAKTLTRIFPSHGHPPAPSHKHSFKPVISEDQQARTSTKRNLDVGDPQLDQMESGLLSLVPPSPPPQDSINRDIAKGKPKPTASRKRLRIQGSDSDEESDNLDDIKLRVASICSHQDKHPHPHSQDLDWDPLLHLRARDHDTAVNEQVDANRHASGTFSINLPDKFRRVLAISPSRSQNSNEDRVVRGLLYGVRIGHYDSSRGGDIWDAGEMDEGAPGDDVIEDDWEGEPVPWEVGEL